MRRIRQRHKSSCGPTCLAMVLGISYNKALEITHPNHIKGKSYSTTFEDIEKVLKLNKVNYIVKHPNKLPKYKKEKAIIYIARKRVLTKGPYVGMLAGHWIVWNPENQEYLDSCNKKHNNYYKSAFKRGTRTVFVIKG